MSKSRKKRRRRVKKHPAKKKDPVSWTWKDRILVWGILLGLLAVALGVRGMIEAQAYQRRIEERIQRWRSKYDLKDSQVEKLLTIEAEFHAYQKLFTFRSSPTQHEGDEHRKQIADILGIQNSQGFEEHLEDQ